MFGIGPMEMLIVVLLGGGTLGLPLGLPPLPPDALIQRAAPAECLYYSSWAGTATPDPKSANQTEQLLAEKEVAEFVNRLDAQFSALLREKFNGSPAGPELAELLPGAIKTLLFRPAAVYVGKVELGKDGVNANGGLVVNCGKAAGQMRKTLEILEGLIVKETPGSKVEDLSIGDIKLRRMATAPGAPPVAWGFQKEYLIVAVGQQEPKELIARMSGKGAGPAWLLDLHKQLPVVRPSLVGYVNVAGILKTAAPLMADPKVPVVLKALGLSNIKHVGTVSGFDKTGMASRTLIALDGEPAGILALASAKPLTLKDLKNIPQNSSMALALRLDLADVYHRLHEGVAQVDPQGAKIMERGLRGFEKETGLKLVEDVLAPLGDLWTLSGSRKPAGGAGGMLGMDPSNITLTVSIRDKARLQNAHDELLAKVRGQIAQQPGNPIVIKESVLNGQRVFYVQAKPGPGGMRLPVSPAWCLTEDRLIVTLSPASLKSLLTRDAKTPSLADSPAAAGFFESASAPMLFTSQDPMMLLGSLYQYADAFGPMLEEQLSQSGVEFKVPPLPSLEILAKHVGPTISTVQRTPQGILLARRQTMPGGGSDLVVAAPLVAGLAFPALQSARGKARMVQTANNLKQILLAIMNYEAANRAFPAAANYDKDGKPLLSWRVHILPYLEQQALYEKFHLNEPWDSEHNRTLIESMPETYANLKLPELKKAGKTQILGVAGDGTLFDGKKGLRFTDVTDGSSNTVMIVEAAPDSAVAWTKPDDLHVDAKDPWKGLRGGQPDGFLAGFADGSVRVIKKKTTAETLRALFSRNGGDVIPGDL